MKNALLVSKHSKFTQFILDVRDLQVFPGSNLGCHRSKLRFYGSKNVIALGASLEKAYKLLGISSSCSKEELKSRYLSLVKNYHPDSGGDTGDVEKFQAVREAYKLIVDNDYDSKAKEELEDLPHIFDIRHTAPQHRQYLEYGGIGSGTPFQRQRQHQKYRVRKASENVQEYLMDKILSTEQSDTLMSVASKKDAEYARRWKTRSGMDRLVEDLIQESMNKGEFDKLPGAGKPLNHDPGNPYIDTMTQKVNKILIQNGFTPEWCLMEKELRQTVREIRGKLLNERSKLPRDLSDWSQAELNSWDRSCSALAADCEDVNKRIEHYNLVVPALSRQMIPLTSKRELKRLDQEFNLSSVPDPLLKEENIALQADPTPSRPQKEMKPRHRESSLMGLYHEMFS